MNKQDIFNFNFNTISNEFNFYTNSTNIDAFNGILKLIDNKILLHGPKKSGKSYLGNLWLNKFNAVLFKHNFDFIINNQINVFIDNIEDFKDEEKIFHIINHCSLNNLSLLISSSLHINDLKFNLKDLKSRINSFTYLKIYKPDDDMLLNILTKLFIEKQFIINSHDVFNYIIKNANRSYEDIFNIVKKLDTLSIEKKRQLTIPLIKEIL